MGMRTLKAAVLHGAPWMSLLPYGLQGWFASGQTNDKEGEQPHLSADNCIKVLLSITLPTRATPSFTTAKSHLSVSLHKPLSLVHQRADRRSKSYNPTSSWWKLQSQKVNKMKMQRISPRWKNKITPPKKKLNEMEIYDLPEKEFRIMIVKMIIMSEK